MSLSVDAALRFLRESNIPFRATRGEWYLQNLSLSSDELIRLCKMLQEKKAPAGEVNLRADPSR